MSPKLKKLSVLIIAAVLLGAMAFAGAASADYIEVSNWNELKNAVKDYSGADMRTIVLNNNSIVCEESSGYPGMTVSGKITIMPNNSGGEFKIDALQKGRFFNVGSAGNLTVQGNGTSTLNLTGGFVTDEENECYGGGVLCYGKFTLKSGAKIDNCSSAGENDNFGGGVHVGSTGTFTMTGGNITGCSVDGDGFGGGVCVDDDAGTFTMTGGNITGCRAEGDSSGGGVCVYAGTFIMTGGNITGCNATSSGGGVYVEDGTFTMTGGNITGCKCDEFGYGICKGGGADIWGTFNVMGTATIKDNTRFNGGTENVYLDWGANLKLLAGEFTGKIGIMSAYPVPSKGAQFGTAELGATGAENFTSDDGNFIGSIDGETLKWIENYDIYITNKTKTYQLTSALTKIYSDDGSGYANLTNADPTTGTYTLELCNFNASCSGKPIINASVPNLTIKLVGESNLTGSYAESDTGLLLSSGNLTIKGEDDSSKLLVNNTKSDSKGVTSIIAQYNLTIDDAKVTAIAHNPGDGGACAIRSFRNNLTITGANTVIDANVTSANQEAYSILSMKDIKIESGAKVIADAHGSSDTYALDSLGGNVSIGSSAVVEANATSTSKTAYSIYASQNLEIASATKVNATAETLGDYGKTAYGLYAEGGNITITESPDVTASTTALASGSRATSMRAAWDIDILLSTAVVHSDANDNSRGIYAESGKLTISDSDVTAVANSTDGGASTLETIGSNADIIISNSKVNLCANSPGNIAVGISTSYESNANITISSSSEVTSIANSSNTAYAMFSGGDITIDGIKSLTAIGNTTSFGYQNKLDMSSLSSSSTYSFSNASDSGAEPKLYTTFVNPNNWHIDPYMGIYLSNYTSVKIEKKSTPTPSYSSSSSRQTGYTQILQEVPTTTPTPTPTDKPATPVVNPTANPTTQPTQSSPVPVAGIIAGLGATALVLARLRK